MIDVAFTRADLRDADVAVVIDVLRATSTATCALAHGFREVICVSGLAAASGWRGPGRVLAGERRCVRAPGFDLGNSPRELGAGRGRQLVLATTNGAPAIVAASACAGDVVLACLLNLDAVVDALLGLEDVQIVCSGTDRAPALEDVYVAGRIVAALRGRRTDAALIAQSVARGFASPLDALAASANAGVLRAAGLGDDVAHCAVESTLGLVPRLSDTVAGAAIIAAAPELPGRVGARRGPDEGHERLGAGARRAGGGPDHEPRPRRGALKQR